MSSLVSVSICTLNRAASLARCLESVLEQGWPADQLEFVVLDDGSSDGTSAAAASFFDRARSRGCSRLRLLRNDRPAGLTAARSRALEAVSADADWVLHIDDDCVLAPGALASLAEAGETEGAGVVAPRLVFLSRPDLLCQSANFVGGWTARYRSSDPPRTTECDWVNGTCLLVRAAALKRLGRLYDGYYMLHEDVELCLAVKALGFKVLYAPAARAFHDAPLELRRDGRLYYLYRNKAVVIRRHFPPPRRWTALGFHLTAGFAKALFDSLRRGRLAQEAGEIAAGFRDAALDRRGPRA